MAKNPPGLPPIPCDIKLATRPFEHICHNGTHFNCDRCDFDTPIRVTGQPRDMALFAVDVAEMIAFHAFNIHPLLASFQGYDTLKFEFH